MRVDGDPTHPRPYRDRPWRRGHVNPGAATFLSRPRASFHDVPARPRQPSSINSQVPHLSSAPNNPQWMKTLEEKYRKLHLKIDSYSERSNSVALQHAPKSANHKVGLQRVSQNKAQGTLDQPLDLARLGKSVLRFSKKTSKYEYRGKSSRTLPGPQNYTIKNDVPVHRKSLSMIENTSRSIYISDISELVKLGVDDSKEQVDNISRTSNGSFHIALKTPRVGKTMSSDKHEQPSVDDDKPGVDIRDRNIQGETDGNSVTDSILYQQEQIDSSELQSVTITQDLDVQRDIKHTLPVKDNLETTIESEFFRPVSGNPSCYSHPSTNPSPRSHRPQSSYAVSESASYYYRREDRATMTKNRTKVRDKRLNVLQGMSEEAKFAINETKKEMDFRAKATRNGSAPSSGDQRKLHRLNTIRPKSEKVSAQGRVENPNPDNRNEDTNDKTTNGLTAKGEISENQKETDVPTSSMDTTIDEDSVYRNVNVSQISKSFAEQSEQFTKLPQIGNSKSTKPETNKQLLHSGKYRITRSAAREKTFQITPPDYDVRFREILTCEIPESETPPPDIKAQAVAKCSEWLNKRCIHNTRSIDIIS